MRRPGTKAMSRSAKAPSSASEVSGEGGTGLPSGSTKVISQRSRTPRSVRWSWRRRAASLGAGGHLNGAPQTPTIARPRSNSGSSSASRSAPATE